MNLLNKNKKQLRWRFKECPRCTGDLNYNFYFDEWACFQCGYVEVDKKINYKKKLC